MTAAFVLAVCTVLLLGWRLRKFELITPQHGIGYALGIIGTSLLVCVLFYSIRKRARKLKRLGSVKVWFSTHMLLGVLGPTLILFHCNFSLGAPNSNAALASMFVVVASGIVGRFLYGRIHRGLYGHRVTLVELRRELEQEREAAGPVLGQIPRLRDGLFQFSDGVIVPAQTVPQSLRRALSVGWRAGWVWWTHERLAVAWVVAQAVGDGWTPEQRRKFTRQICGRIRRFLAQTLQVAQFSFYERVFALWHAVHIPLVVVVAVTTTIHIIAVNRY